MSRAGRFINQIEGYVAFEPAPLPPVPPIDAARLQYPLSQADLALGRLDGTTRILPNPDLFVAMYVRREAVLSSQIEGTQASLTDLLSFEAEDNQDNPLDVEEVVNYIRAMNHGLERLASFPLSLRLICEIHERLMQGVRGQDRQPGQFRTSQNWVGSGGASMTEAAYVPPPPRLVMTALGDLESFLHDTSLPPLLQAGLAHAQFETIHPFLDGNGRVGRLLITFLLCHRDAISKPLLYLSHFLKRRRQEYYDRLQAIRTGGRWEEWLEFFLLGVQQVANEARKTAGKIIALRETHRERLSAQGRSSGNQLRTLDYLFENPMVTPRRLELSLVVTFATANKVLARMENLGLLIEATGQRRNRRFIYEPYRRLFDDSEATP